METPDFIIKLLGLQGTDWVSCIFNFVGTILAVFAGSLFTMYLYNKERKDKLLEETERERKQKIENINILLVHLLECIYDAQINYKQVKEQENIPRAERVRFVAENDCDPELVISLSRTLVSELPSVVLKLNDLRENLKWTNKYRENRNNAMNKTEESYKKEQERELNWNKKMINSVLPPLLVIYDYAINVYGKNPTIFTRAHTILMISQSDYINYNIWEYLDSDFSQVKIESSLQYKFKTKAIVKWFFKDLKEKYEIEKAKKKK